MKVMIDRKESHFMRGIFFRKKIPTYHVKVAVEFSELERAIIREKRLGPTVVHTIKSFLSETDDMPYSLSITIDKLIKDKNALGHMCSFLNEADDYEVLMRG